MIILDCNKSYLHLLIYMLSISVALLLYVILVGSVIVGSIPKDIQKIRYIIILIDFHIIKILICCNNNVIFCIGYISHYFFISDNRFTYACISLSGIVLRHTGVDSEHVTGGFRARKNCERVSNICVLKSVISW